ncbi:MAG: DUF2095 family protein [Candidatus Hodarchaeales archaeon]
MSNGEKNLDNNNDSDKEKKIMQQKLIVDSYHKKFDEEEFKANFPTLYRELNIRNKQLGLKIAPDDVGKKDENDFDKGAIVDEGPVLTLEEIQRRRKELDPLCDYDPGIIDFIRRAKIPEDAIEVVEYMRDRGEITEDQAKELIAQIENNGLESFGQHKPDGYYFHYASDERMKKSMKKLKKKDDH